MQILCYLLPISFTIIGDGKLSLRTTLIQIFFSKFMDLVTNGLCSKITLFFQRSFSDILKSSVKTSSVYSIITCMNNLLAFLNPI